MLVLLGVVLAVAALAGPARAHPLGNFTVNQHDALRLAPGQLRVEHVEDLAEIPATQAKPAIDRQGKERWARERCARAASGTRVRVGGRPAPITVAGPAHATVRTGQAGLPTVRVTCRFAARLPRGPVALTFRAPPQAAPGWREVTARGDRMTLTGTDVPASSPSRHLTRYPAELRASPPDTTTATLRARPGGPAAADEATPPGSPLPRAATDALTGLVARHELTLPFAALALATALALGALHALAPGHGKTLMAATAAARGRATVRDVLPLAASVTVTHTLGVVALGLLVAGGSAAAPSVVAWLGVASGALVTGAGALLLRRAWRHRAHAHPHTHDHPHDHTHAHPHAHAHTAAPPHAPPHDHAHPHHAPHTHTPHDHAHPHPTPLTHAPPGPGPARPSLRGTLFLGFAGGLVPSPSAVVVLVGAAALGEAWFGLLLVLAYGAGLAVTLTAAGFLVVRVGARLSAEAGRRLTWRRNPARLARRLAPLGSACLVLALGCGLVFKGAATALG
ncbi:nickel transporter [Streptomyces sp. G45]|uniref:HoxN/HupN/NixA family nickel/cobalt transporter n=1 Tax=Streptomyces sp. G45 TaxID=3406627 RepID=UPI003C23B661